MYIYHRVSVLILKIQFNLSSIDIHTGCSAIRINKNIENIFKSRSMK